MQEKIKTFEEIEKIVSRLKLQNKKIGTTSGSFDILHAGHVNFLEKAKKVCDVLIVLLNTDLSIQKNKGINRPIVPQKERLLMLAGLQAVNYVVLFDEEKPLHMIQKLQPNVHVKGGSWDSEKLREEIHLVESWGGQYITFSLDEGYSTTNLIETIKEKYGLK